MKLLTSVTVVTAIFGACVGAEAIRWRLQGGKDTALQIQQILIDVGYKECSIVEEGPRFSRTYTVHPYAGAPADLQLRTWMSGRTAFWDVINPEMASTIKGAGYGGGAELDAIWHDGEMYTHTDAGIKHTVWPGGPLPTERVSA